MKKGLVSLMIGLLMLGVSGNVWAGNVVAADLVCTNPAGCVQTNEIIDGAVTEPKLATGAVTNGKIVDGAVSNAKIADGAVTTTKVGDGTITEAKITDGAVTTNKISDGTVTEPKLANGTVTNGKLADGAITDAKISVGAVTNTKIADGAITNSKLADWSVTGSQIVDFSITDTKISSNAVTMAKIADGSVTDVKIMGPISGSKLGSHTHDGTDITDGTVTTSKISDGAITDAKITGTISASKIEKPANVVVVAKSGGDFTSIQAAIDSINPSAENPYLIKVMPGTYGGERITLKSYMHLQGSGRNVTIIQGNIPYSYDYTDCPLTLNNLTDVMITGFTIKEGYSGIYIINSSGVTIKDNAFSASSSQYCYYGIFVTSNSSSVTIAGNQIASYGSAGLLVATPGAGILIMDNLITENRDCGIWNTGSTPTILGNVITRNGGPWAIGIFNHNSSATISNNIITENTYDGIFEDNSTSVITNNRITGNTRSDIYVYAPSTPKISFNVYDNIVGTTGMGMYNVKSDGTAATEP